MSQDELGSIPGRGCAARRFGDGILRLMGNNQVTLRLANASSGDTSSQLGLEAPPTADLPISPVLLKPLQPTADRKRRLEVVISATLLRPIAKNYGVEDISAWLLSFEGVVWGEELMRIETVTVDKFLGVECLFHLIATE